MSVTEKMICITCPMGCTLQVTHEDNKVLNVEGNGCPRGKRYAQEELTDPRRMVATTVRVNGGLHPLVPVYTAAPIPKQLIFELLAQIRQIEINAPVEIKQVVLANVLNTGIDVVASRDMPLQVRE
ncbi:MAG: DUF1667 domain-containing protein [Chloroflexota bacterium]|nr:DUF1667 domain-containing protein [Chloroflexota bacterium]